MIGQVVSVPRIITATSQARALVFVLALAAAVPLGAADRFRILFGGADETVVDWSGSLAAAGGSAEIVAAHHFGAEESFERSAWRCGNQWDGHLQMEPRDEAAFSPTRWKGVVVDVAGGDAVRVSIQTAQGEAEFRPGQVRFHEPLERLDGRMRIERVPPARRMSDALADDDYPAIAIGARRRVLGGVDSLRGWGRYDPSALLA